MPSDVRILLVEDNPGDARLIREMLLHSPQNERMELVTVSTLGEAFHHVGQRIYDAVLLDLSLPDSHGIATLLKMRAEASQTAIVVLTGMHDERLGVEAVQVGAQDYLPKGDVDSRLLVRSIRYAIERHHTEMALRRSQQEYRSLIDDVFDTSMVAVLILDRSFQVVWCNEATETYFGIRRERLLGRDKRQLIDEELKCIFADPDAYSTSLLSAYAEGSFTDRFECLVTNNGDREERWLEHWSQPIRNGIFTGGRIEQYTDITEHKRLEVAEREQREFAEALTDISTLLTSSLNLQNVLNAILSNLGRVVSHDSASIAIFDEEQFQIAQQETSDKAELQEMIAHKQLQLLQKQLSDGHFKQVQSSVVRDLQQYPEVHDLAAEANIHAYVSAPIQVQDDIIGFINLLSEEPSFFTASDMERLSAFSRLAAIAIQNARLFDQSRQLATLQERQRLARELHDSVSQTIFTCRTLSETALRRWSKDPTRAYDLIVDINKLTATALAEMRILLLELRPVSLTDVSLKQLFEQYLQPIQERHAFELKLAIEEIPPLPAEVQLALYRITQEALNNIDKHAQATKVEVRAKGNQDKLIMEIRDNGRGFQPDQVAATHLGLNIMRERAEEIGAAIRIDSEIGRGTRISLFWNRN